MSIRLAEIVGGLALLACSGCASLHWFAPAEVMWMKQHQMSAKEPLCAEPIASDVRWVYARTWDKGGFKSGDDETRPLLAQNRLWQVPTAITSQSIFSPRASLLAKKAESTRHPILAEWVRTLTARSAVPAMAPPVHVDLGALAVAQLVYAGRYGDVGTSAGIVAQQYQNQYDAQQRIQSGTPQLGDGQMAQGLEVLPGQPMLWDQMAMALSAMKEINDREVLMGQVTIEHTLRKTGAVSKRLPSDRVLFLYVMNRAGYLDERGRVTDVGEVLAFVTRGRAAPLSATRKATLIVTVNDPTPPRPGMVAYKPPLEMPMYVAADAVYELCTAAELESSEPVAAR